MTDSMDKTRKDFEGVLEVLADDLSMVKTGRAKPALIEKIMVEAYEGQSKISLIELASITSPDSQQLIVKPWDQSILEKIEKAIAQVKELQLNPVVDGDIIRIKIPHLTEERRKDLVKLVKQKLESGRVLLRQERHKAKETIDAQKGKPGISEDDIHDEIEDLNKLTDEFTKKIDEMGEAKEKELMTV